MTKKECAVVMAYTGACMLIGKDFTIFHEYVEKLMNRPVFTHELCNLRAELAARSRRDFIELCRRATNE